MKLILPLLISVFFLGACREQPKEVGSPQPEVAHQTHLPSKDYHYVKNVPALKVQEIVYVPIYSDIYVINGHRKYSLTATLSVRNTSPKASMYVSKVDYYDSKGSLMRKYIQQPILLKPLESVEFIVDYLEKEGGAGANFLVEWGSPSASLRPVIQAVMIGSTNHQGISFVTNGVTIDSSTK